MPVHDVFDELNAAYARRSRCTCPPARCSTEPIVVTHHVAGDGAAVFPRLVVDAGADSEFTVVERFEIGADVRALVVPAWCSTRRQAARVQLPRRQPAGATRCGSSATSRPSASATRPRCWPRWRSAATTPGCAPTSASSARVPPPSRSRSTSPTAHQMHDFRTLQDHVAPKTNSDLLFKGAVQDTAQERLHRPHPHRARTPRARSPSRPTAT